MARNYKHIYFFTGADLVVVFIVAFDGEVCMIVASLSDGVYLSTNICL